MAKSLLITGTQATTVNLPQGTTRYFVCANAPLIPESTENNTKITYHTAGVMSNLYCRVTASDTEDVSTLRRRVNGADGASSISIAAATTGEFEDTTNTDTVSDGTVLNYSVDVGAGDPATFLRFGNISSVFAPTTDTMVRHAAINFATQTNAVDVYAAPSDDCVTQNTGGTSAKFNFNAAGLVDDLYVYVSSMPVPPPVFTATVTLVKNASATGLAATLTGTGAFENSTSVSVAANDDIYTQTATTGVGSIVVEVVSFEWTSTAKYFHSVFGRTGAGMGNIIFATTRYFPAGGGSTTTATEDNAKTEMQIAATVSNLTAYCSINSLVP